MTDPGIDPVMDPVIDPGTDPAAARLVDPDVRFHRSFLEAMGEFADEGRRGDDSNVGHDLATWSDRWASPDAFAAYVGQVLRTRVEPPPGFVTWTTLWWVEGEEYLGRVAVRHHLTERLLEVGGHIGYDVRPIARRRGHATAMLAAVLPVARDLGIDPALVTCDHDNVGSRKVIEANGGRLEDRRGVKLRYWVPTA